MYQERYFLARLQALENRIQERIDEAATSQAWTSPGDAESSRYWVGVISGMNEVRSMVRSLRLSVAGEEASRS
jgi:hypothetical protein